MGWVVFLISTSVSSYSYGTNVDQRFFIFEDKNKSVLSTEINYSRFAPVNQLNLNAMPIILDKVIKNIEKYGYVNNEVAKNSRHFEVISYGGTVKEIYFLMVSVTHQSSSLKFMQRILNSIKSKVFD